jgi:hypothetical protein
MDFQQKAADECTNGPVDAYDASLPSSNKADQDNLADDKSEAAMGTPISSSSSCELSLEYRVLAETMAEMASTTKRNVNLKTLKDLLVNVIQSVGGIGQRDDRTNGSIQLTCTIDLVLGKSSVMTSDDTITSSPRPLQVSGSAVSIAVQSVTGYVSETNESGVSSNR